MKVSIIKIGINGEGIGYIDTKPVFVDGVLPEEEVDIKVTEKQPRFCRGEALKLVKRSPVRVQPPCRYVNECGGCSMMHIRYDAQLTYKYDILRQTLIKYAQVNPRKIEKVHKNPEPFGYRNALKLPFSMDKGEIVCGLYSPGSNHFNRIDHCMIYEKGLEKTKKEILSVLNKFHINAYDRKTRRGMRSLVLRGFEEHYQCTLVTGNDTLSKECVEALSSIEGMDSLWQSVHTSKSGVDVFGKTMTLLSGTKLLEFSLDRLKLRVSPKAFFQLNTAQAKYMYESVEKMVGGNHDFIVEAYSGIGGVSMYLRNNAREIVGIESIQDAVSNANRNAQLNNIKNVRFVCGDAADTLRDYSKKRNIDVLVVDPPRSGLDENMLECILRSKISSIVYISCNPATLGKNIAVLQKYYDVENVQPVDVFSQSAHIESIVKLARR